MQGILIKSVTKNISYLNAFQPTSLFFHQHIPSFFSNCCLFCILAVQISEEVGVAAAASHTHTHTLLSHSHTQRAKPRLDGCLSGGERWERGNSFHSDSSPWRQSPRPPSSRPGSAPQFQTPSLSCHPIYTPPSPIILLSRALWRAPTTRSGPSLLLLLIFLLLLLLLCPPFIIKREGVSGGGREK